MSMINEDEHVLLSPLGGGGRSEKILHKSCIEIQEKLKIFQAPRRVVSPEFVQDFDAGFFESFRVILGDILEILQRNPARILHKTAKKVLRERALVPKCANRLDRNGAAPYAYRYRNWYGALPILVRGSSFLFSVGSSRTQLSAPLRLT